jgi:RNA-directed DNA polymerase
MKNKTDLAPFLYESCEELSQKFKELKSPYDVAQLLQVSYEYLIYYIYRTPHDYRYTKFQVPKKSRGYRTIHSPNGSLGIVQRKLSQVLYAVYRPRPSVHGFATSRSIITNAKAHVGKKFILNLDIKDFFGSINFGRVRGLFMGKPYELDKKVATILAQICCFDDKLPQGAPTSPIVSNLICAKMDSELQRFSREPGLFYTRYADDITLSSNRQELPVSLVSSYEKGSSKVVLGDELRGIIERNGFRINEAKVRLSYNKTQRQEVTGLIVNQTVNVSRKYVRNIDGALHAWEKYGLQAATETYESKYAKKVTLPEKELARFVDSLRGKIEFVGSVRGKDDYLYQKLLSKFNDIRKKEADNQKLTETEDPP